MVKRNAVRRSYDELAERYADERSADGPGTVVLSEFLASLPTDGRILDAGCGAGKPVLERLATEHVAVGLDFSRRQLELASGAVPGAAHVQADMMGLPFEDDSFDAVVVYWSLIHLPLADHPTAIEEFARVLRPGGRALVCEGTDPWVGENPDWLDSGTEMGWEIAGVDATTEQLAAAGFELVDRWNVPETLNDDSDGEWDPKGDHPWTFFDVRLE